MVNQKLCEEANVSDAYASSPPRRWRTTTPPMKPRTTLSVMYKTYVIAGVSIVAKSLVEAYRYYREFCTNQKG